MTTIAFANGELAADGLTTTGDMVVSRNSQKVFRLPDGSICAGTGPRMVLFRYREWLRAGREGERPSLTDEARGERKIESYFLVARPDGVLEFHDPEGIEELEDETYAVGSGEMAARAALHLGASATEAVQVAAELDVYTGGAIHSERVGKPTTLTEITEHPIENIDAPTREWRDRYNLRSRSR